ncbi:MAG: DNA polymerase III subunit alpha [bacterium]
MKHADFVHLHVHTSYSLLDGACRISDLTRLAADMRFPALAITDHGGMFGVVEFYEKALAAGIKPIIGSEFYIAPGSRTERQADKSGETAYHVILLARNLDGYHNLLKLSSVAYLDGFYYKPRIDRKILSEHSDGLIALSGCLSGEVAKRLSLGLENEAIQSAQWYRDVFPDSYYLELQHNGLEEQTRINSRLAEMSADLNIPTVATNDVHYLKRDDRRMHDVLLCIQTGKTVNDENRMSMDSQELHLKSAEEMKAQFSDYPEALKNTLEIAERCNLEIPLGKTQMPKFDVPDDMSTEAYLAGEARKGFESRMEVLKQKIPEDQWEETLEKYQKRLGSELETVTEMGYSSYFLVVWDFIRFARGRGIPVGPGRGSAAGSLVAYSLSITDIDPIEYGLLFERFLNPERISMPDIDVDFCMDRREEVLKYVYKKYGEDHVAQIITFGTMAARGAIRDVGRALDMSYAEVDRIAKLVPDVLNIKLAKAIEQEPQLKTLADKDKRVADLLELALKVEGLQRHASTHAAGVVISSSHLDESVPLYKGTKGDEVITQFDMNVLERLGLVKFDFLGLRTLTMIDYALSLVNRKRQIGKKENLVLEDLDLNDPETYDLLSSGETDGVFQLESSGMRDLLVKIKPTTFEDLIAIVALYRPGPLGSGMVTDYIERKHGRKEVIYDLDELETILSETYGVAVYQEQVMQIAQKLANFSLGEADILRRAMGKKKRDEMQQQRERFIEGCKENGTPERKATEQFEKLKDFAEYGFNKSHSAAYALISFRTAYLKAHYPSEFMAALLTSEMDNSDKVTAHIGVCKVMGISVLPPDINESGIRFTVSGDGIRFGLGAVKNVGVAALEETLRVRTQDGAFASLEDLCMRVDLRKVNRRVVESLIKSGAFDKSDDHRAQYLAALDKAMERGQKAARDRENGQITMFDAQADAGVSQGLPDVEPWTEQQRLTYEKESLGFYITGHPLEKYDHEMERYVSSDLSRLAELSDGESVRVAGITQNIKEINTKKGDRMAFVTLEDLHGSAEIIVFSDVFKENSSIILSSDPILVQGILDTSGDKPKVKAQKMYDLESYRKKVTKVVQIDLTTIGLSREDLDSLKDVLKRHEGNCSVKLKLTIPTKAEALIRLGEDFKVSSSEDVVLELEEIFGHGIVTFQ